MLVSGFVRGAWEGATALLRHEASGGAGMGTRRA